MNNKLDYSSEEAMKILKNESLTDEQKKAAFEKYKSDLQAIRRKEIVSRVNELAQRLPNITQEIYLQFLKKYDKDDLSTPFLEIEKDIKVFENEMAQKYNEYLENKKREEESKIELPVVEEPVSSDDTVEVPITPDVVPEVQMTEDTNNIISDDLDEKIEPTLILGQSSVLNEEPETLAKPLFDDKAKDVMPNTIPETEGEKGNASAIILSIIAIIVGAVVMYTIIKMN